MDHPAIIHHRHIVAHRARHVEILFDQQDRRPARLLFQNAGNQIVDHRGSETLGRLVDDHQPPLLHDGARHGQHLFLPAGHQPGTVMPFGFQDREEAEHIFQPGLIESRRGGGEAHVFGNGELRENSHRLRHIGNAAPGDLRRLLACDLRAVEADGAGARLPQPHDAAQRGGFAGAVAAKQHRHPPPAHGQIHTMQNVIGADIRHHARKVQQRVIHALPPFDEYRDRLPAPPATPPPRRVCHRRPACR